MITLKIGSEERKDSSIKERWITRQIRKRRKDDGPICVNATIKTGDINILLMSAECNRGRSGIHKPNKKERKLSELWNERGLNGKNITTGMIISFLRQYRQYV